MDTISRSQTNRRLTGNRQRQRPDTIFDRIASTSSSLARQPMRLRNTQSHVVSTRETTDCTERSTNGLICQSCELLATCILRDSVWLTAAVEKCDVDNGYYCNVAQRGCSNETGPCHPFGYVGNFPCTSEGVFPDPYDCQRYHMCYNHAKQPVPANIECGSNRAFAAATGDCSATLNDTVCTEPQFNCSRSGDTGAWPGNANIFYVCSATLEHGRRILFPTLHRCAAAEIFNGRDCVARDAFSVENSTLPSTTAMTTRPKFECKKVGLFVDVFECQAYYYCNSLLLWTRYFCPDTTHFDNAMKVCLPGTECEVDRR